MTDRELLEAAAKAAGYALAFNVADEPYVPSEFGGHARWNPLTDSGDALDLAVKLSINVAPNYHAEWHIGTGEAFRAGREFTTEAETDPYAATRRAIVRAAADIATAKEPQ